MILAFLRLFEQFRALDEALESQVRANLETEEQLRSATVALDAERTRRISAETVASERREEIGRLIDQARELRDDLANANRERLRSLDAINVKLMEPRVADPAPDMTRYSRPGSGNRHDIVAVTRELHHKFDMALLAKYSPQRSARPTVNEAQPVEPPVVTSDI